MFKNSALLGAAIAGGIASTSYAEVFTFQTSFNGADFSTQYLTENWLPVIKERTDGRVEISLTSNGSVVPARETPEAVAVGVLDGEWTASSYFSGREPAFALLGDLISGYDTPAQMRGFCETGAGEEMLQAAVSDITDGEVTVIGCGPYSREALPARTPIRTFEDLEGLKIRAPEGLASAVFEAAGAVPLAIPFSEVFGALEKGIADAADASAYVNNVATGLHDVAPYPLYPGIHSMPSMQFTMNNERWESLSEDDQATLRAWWYEAMAALEAEVQKQDEELAAADNASDNIEVINWPQAERDKLRVVARAEWEEFASKSELARTVLDAHIEYMTSIGLLD